MYVSQKRLRHFVWAWHVGSKKCTRVVTAAMWAVTTSLWAVITSMWAVTAAMGAVADFMWDVTASMWTVAASIWTVAGPDSAGVNSKKTEKKYGGIRKILTTAGVSRNISTYGTKSF